MMNQVILVGRLQSITISGETTNILIRVPKPYKNEKGEREDDEITCMLHKNMNDVMREYCNPGDVVGIKGRVQNIKGDLTIVAEKITFLSSKHQEVKDYE